MKKLFVDTNIVIDLLSRREPDYAEAATLFSLADKKLIELAVSSLTIANTSYALLRQMDSNKAKSILRKLRLIIKVLPLDDKIIGLALNDESFSDFEDALQHFTAIEKWARFDNNTQFKRLQKLKTANPHRKSIIETIQREFGLSDEKKLAILFFKFNV
ncbi:MAG: PIN domain-containing protein [Cyclobacteriaceae bacterium]|nr:PIN domain-containing protein [Cyclobacteriaceae bacterium]